MNPIRITGRLRLDQLEPPDAFFILQLVNDPDWLRFIGDRGIRDEAGARDHIVDVHMAAYQRNGFGLYKVSLLQGGESIGMCGLVKREGLDDVDLGFAFLPEFRGRGYALEAARAVLAHAREDLGLDRVVAITNPGNVASIRLLEKLGMKDQGLIQLPGIEGDSAFFAP